MSAIADPMAAALTETRARTFELVSELDHHELETVHSTLLSPLVWDLGHIAAFEDLWISRTFGTPMLAPELVLVYDADETPRAERGDLPFLKTDEARDYMARTRANTLAVLADHEAPEQDRRLELIVRHELQHNETMTQTLQIAGLPCGLTGLREPSHSGDDGLRLIPVDGGSVKVGSRFADGFSYDNEQPRHSVELPSFAIATTPVSSRAWLQFVEEGGYLDRRLWSEEGWRWRRAENVERPLYWEADGSTRRFDQRGPVNPELPVCHISCFEAEAFARFHDARLPTEFEWEAAATGSQAGELSGMSASVWQWTSSEFGGYPGFRADPYPEYSEQFFARGYQVLRGGAWVSSPRVATVQFRNWDHPQRRQIFSGMRLARDL